MPKPIKSKPKGRAPAVMSKRTEEEEPRKGGMSIVVPESLGGELRLLPPGNAKATLEKIMVGKSKSSGQAKATFRYTITEEMEGLPDDAPTTVGEAVLETYSLQPQAMFRLNDVYKMVLGERLPQGEWTPEEFEERLNEDLCGTEWNLVLENQVPSDGSSTEERTVIVAKTLVE